MKEVEQYLKDLGIEYKIVNHPPAITTELADQFIEGHEGVRTKTMFLTNKKKTKYFLVIMDDNKRLDMNSFKEYLGESNIKMASSNSLKEKMDLEPGVVSIFGLLNNKEKDIRVFIDKDIAGDGILTFHPNTNEATLFIKTLDAKKFLESLDYKLEEINL